MAGRLMQVMERNRADERRLRRGMSRLGMGHRVNVGSIERVASTVAGGVLAIWGLKRRGPTGYGMALVGAELLYRGTTGHCPAYSALGLSTHVTAKRGEPARLDHARSVDVRHRVLINRPRGELYAIWRDFSTLPQFMEHLERVDVVTPYVSHWVTKGVAGVSVSWDAEIVDEREGEWISWRAIEPAQVPNSGTVMFRDAPDGGTEVLVTLEAQPPAGRLGALVAQMFGRSPDRQVRLALARFKEMAEQQHPFGAHAADRHGPIVDREVGLERGGLSDLPPHTGSATFDAGPSVRTRDEANGQ